MRAKQHSIFTIKRHFRRICGIDDSNHIVLINMLKRSPSEGARRLKTGNQE
jgi:hypothetical protein